MTASTNKLLFSWDDVEYLPDLQRLEFVLRYLPGEDLLRALNEKRGRGRGDYPVEAMWRALVAGVVFQHPSIAALIRELRRNPALLGLCGFNPLPRQGRPAVVREATAGAQVTRLVPAPLHDSVPGDANFSRLLRNLVDLEEQQGLVSAMVDTLRKRLIEALPDFGKHPGYDGKAIDSHSTGHTSRKTGKTSDPDADWGKHETFGTDHKTGQAWKKVKSWFGYGLHLIADTGYEIPVAFQVTKASASEPVVLSREIRKLFAGEPALRERCEDFSADRGLDSGPLKQTLWDDYGIRPLIDTREMWRTEKEMPDYDPSQPILRPLYPERVDTVLHSEKGEVVCRCPDTGKERPMAFQGFEAERVTLKYRCPAAAYGLTCKGRESCYRGAGCQAGAYGRIVRIDLNKHDRRIFTPTPHGGPSWRRGYNRRSALERINSRIDRSFGFELHFVRGQAKIQARVGLALAVMMALALGSVREGRPGRMRSLVHSPPLADTG